MTGVKEKLLQPGTEGFVLAQFTGRPAFMNLMRSQQACLKQILIEMELLAESSLINGSSIRARVEKRKDGARFLRWYAFGRNRNWEDILPDMKALTAPVKRHFESVNRRMGELNVLSLMYQQSIKRLEAHLKNRKASNALAEQ